MARLPFAGTANDYTFSTYTLGASKLVALTGATLTFFDAETGGNQVTDLTDEQGNAISSVVVPDTGDIPRFYGPSGTSELWVSANGSTNRTRIVTAQIDSTDDAVSTLAGDPASQLRIVLDGEYASSGRTVNGHALTGDVTLAAGDVGAVPTTRKVNGKALSADVTLTPADTGAQPAASLEGDVAGKIGKGGALDSALSTAYASPGEKRSQAKADGTDQTSVVQAELDALYDAGGGTLVLPASPLGAVPIKVANLTLKNDGATVPRMPNITLRGQGALWSGRDVTAPVGGTIIEFTGTDTYGLIKSNALGALTLTNLTLRNTNAATTTPFVYVTNTTLHAVRCSFLGANTAAACNQDAIVLGGPNQVEGGSGWTDGFQGYGSTIVANYFSGIATCVRGQAYANGIIVRDNTVWRTCGNTSGAPFDWNGAPGSPSSQSAAGCVISGNLIEVTNYKYAVSLKKCVGFTVAGNNIFDNQATTAFAYYLDSACASNIIQEGYSGSINPVVDDHGTNNWFHASSQGVYAKMPPAKFLDVNYPTIITQLLINGMDSFTAQPDTPPASSSHKFLEFKRSATDATNPGASVWFMRYDGSVQCDPTAANAGNWTGPYANWNHGGRYWSAVGTATGQSNGSTMEIDSGPGGSYLNLRNYAVRFYDHNNGPLRVRVGAGKDGFDLGSASDLSVQRDSTGSLAVNKPVKTQAVATASRPTASSVGAGAQMFDTTLNKPIWSTGSAWVDATGAAV